MYKIKKTCALFLAVVLIGLCACNGNSNNPENSLFGQRITTGEHSMQGQEITTTPSITGESLSIPTANAAGKRCVAYFTSWSAYARNITVGDMDPTLLTHINFAFANLNPDGEIVVGDSWVDLEKPFGNESWDSPSDSRGHFNALRQMKEQYPHIRTLISVGGWTWSKNFSDVAATDAGRAKFAQSAAAFVSRYGFDGVDIDWEFPVEGGDNITHRAEDKQNYTKLLAETRKALDAQGTTDGKHYLLTIAGGPNVSFAKNTELKAMMQYLDFINVMTYDYHGGWENATNHNAPLHANPNDPTENKDFSVENTINAYLGCGVEPQDLNLGLAFYGRGWIDVAGSANNGLWQSGKAATSVGYGMGTWEGACFDYWDLVQNYIGKNGYTRYYDETAQAPYLFNGSSFISYDDPQSIKAKLAFADAKNLGGVMFWEFSGDKTMELQKVIAEHYGIQSQAASAGTQSSTGETQQTAQPTSSVAGAAEWDASTAYTGGETVAYQGKQYRAKWWTQGDTPDPAASDGPWEAIS